MLRNLVWNLRSLTGRCGHGDNVLASCGPIVHGGSSLASGAVVGHWYKTLCLECGCTRVDREMH